MDTPVGAPARCCSGKETMRHALRPLIALAAGLLIATTLAVAPAHAGADDRGARWLERQLTDGLVHNDQYDFDDYGLSADLAMALADIGGRRDTVREVRRALARNVNSWTTGADFGTDDVYAGSVAKALVLAQVAGGDPRDFGNVNLVRRLKQRVSDEQGIRGRIEDRSATDFANTIGQSFAARGLARADSGKARVVIRFLLEQQCSPGYFRLNFADKTKRRQSCDAGDRKTVSAPDTDVTALAVLSLDALPRSARTKATRRAIDNATDWLLRAQKENGSFGGGTATEASNANSTGLAGWALGEVGACRMAQDAARWVRRLQVRGDVSGTPLAGEKGAIAYDRDAFRQAQQDGITSEQRDQWRRASTQAAPALRNLRIKACG